MGLTPIIFLCPDLVAVVTSIEKSITNWDLAPSTQNWKKNIGKAILLVPTFYILQFTVCDPFPPPILCSDLLMNSIL